jgi:hypothetical protein
MDWINLAQDSEHWRAVLNIVMGSIKWWEALE